MTLEQTCSFHCRDSVKSTRQRLSLGCVFIGGTLYASPSLLVCSRPIYTVLGMHAGARVILCERTQKPRPSQSSEFLAPKLTHVHIWQLVIDVIQAVI